VTGLPKGSGRIMLALMAEGTRQSASWQNIPDDGVVRFDNVAPGDYELALMCDSRRVHSVPITLRAGPNATTFQAPSLHTLTVLAEDLALGDVILLKPADAPDDDPWAGRSTVRLDKNRQAVFRGLPAGDYLIESMGGKRSGSMRVSVPAESVVRFVASARNAIRVVVTDEKGYLRQAGFLSEDLIVAFNAVALKEVGSVDEILQGLKAMEKIYATVVRGEKIFELELNAGKVLEGNAGGRLIPIQISWK
jgi:hypothetical protein